MPAGRLLDLDLLGDLTRLDQGPGDPYMAQLIEDFAVDARSTIDYMRSLAGCGKSSVIAREAHRLRGSSGSIGAPGLAHGYGEIESRACAGATSGLAAHIEETARLLDRTMEAMQEFLRMRGPRVPGDSIPGGCARLEKPCCRNRR